MKPNFLWAGLPDMSEPTDSQKWNYIIRYKNDLLTKSDWTQLPDTELTAEQVEEWRVYRQQLRDLTDTYTNPDDVLFPSEPIAQL